ncbi:MAG TPA: SPOR domain-containing protein [Usitatibacter sp.]|nr:SPOR domain-containing protein [Usitatibacter sp.]
MASTATTEASEIRRRGRQRLIGAVAIAVLLVVFVPMILDKEPRSDHVEPSLTIPPKDNVEPLPAPAKARAAAPAPVEPAKAAAEAPKAAPAAEPPKATPAPSEPLQTAATPKLEGFAVQVGAFKDEAKLKQAREKLVAAKVPHYIERRSTSSGELTRLRAGPFPTREAAEKALATMKTASLNGQVVPLP